MAKKELAPIAFDDLDGGRLPDVCVMTGAPATKTLSKTFVNAPAWPFVLWPISLIAALVGRIAGSRSVTAELPVAEGVRKLTGITARQSRGWLILRGVHPSFARAMGKFYADRADEIPLS